MLIVKGEGNGVDRGSVIGESYLWVACARAEKDNVGRTQPYTYKLAIARPSKGIAIITHISGPHFRGPALRLTGADCKCICTAMFVPTSEFTERHKRYGRRIDASGRLADALIEHLHESLTFLH